MITTKKLFGSYVNESPTALFAKEVGISTAATITNDDDAAASFPFYASCCAIPSSWTEVTLLSSTPYNNDTNVMRFALPRPDVALNLPLGGYLLFLAPGKEKNQDTQGREVIQDAIRPYTSVSSCDSLGYFDLLCKRYDEWGVKEVATNMFFFTQATNHSYRPPGAVSTWLHSLKPGDKVKVCHTQSCVGKILPHAISRGGDAFNASSTSGRTLYAGITKEVTHLTMISVGIGIAPMIQMLDRVFRYLDSSISSGSNSGTYCDIESGDNPISFDGIHKSNNISLIINRSIKIVLLYGAREVKDVLLRERLQAWAVRYPSMFKVVYCIGSRWANVHVGALLKDKDSTCTNGSSSSGYLPPPPPKDFHVLEEGPARGLAIAETGWVNEDKIRRYGFPPAESAKVMVCGLPGVYEHICGSRFTSEVAENSALGKLGYSSDMVIKL